MANKTKVNTTVVYILNGNFFKAGEFFTSKKMYDKLCELLEKTPNAPADFLESVEDAKHSVCAALENFQRDQFEHKTKYRNILTSDRVPGRKKGGKPTLTYVLNPNPNYKDPSSTSDTE